MNLLAWILQIVLGALFLGVGATKISQPKDKLRSKMTWVDDYTDSNVKLIGGLEVLAALGLVLPWATGIAKILTPLAAVGLAIIMIGAVFTHRNRKEPWIPQLVLLIMTIVVAVIRF
jgi:uncharacterized membrane protein YphA (DoxX/SURF4 family)